MKVESNTTFEDVVEDREGVVAVEALKQNAVIIGAGSARACSVARSREKVQHAVLHCTCQCTTVAMLAYLAGFDV